MSWLLPCLTRKQWLLGFRDIARATDERTAIVSVVPPFGIGHTVPLILGPMDNLWLLESALNSIALDYVARQKVSGTHLTYFFVRQFPAPTPRALDQRTPWTEGSSVREWLRPRVAELVGTSTSLQPFLDSIDQSDVVSGWDVGRRAMLRAEIDAAFFHLYGLTRSEVEFILDTFPIVHKNDLSAYGERRTERLTLEQYDLMQTAIEQQMARLGGTR